MQVKKRKGKVFGGSMSAAEKKAAEIEIRKQLAEFDQKNAMELDALVLWILHNQFGFGEKRLKRFYDAFAEEIFKLVDRYIMEDSDAIWLCTFDLERDGIDIKKWHEEFQKKLEERGKK
jgi:hypothetical protein